MTMRHYLSKYAALPLGLLLLEHLAMGQWWMAGLAIWAFVALSARTADAFAICRQVYPATLQEFRHGPQAPARH